MAQKRRRDENTQIHQLASVLPVSKAISSEHMDKTSVVRVASTFIRLQTYLSSKYPRNAAFRSYDNTNPLPSILELLDGFLIFLTEDGQILYLSETISIYLGLSQVDLTGNNICEYIHQDDLFNFYNLKDYAHSLLYSHNIKDPVTISMRMKSTLTKRSNKEIFKQFAGYKIVQADLTWGSLMLQGTITKYYLLYCQPVTTAHMMYIKLKSFCFVMTLTLDFKVCYVEAETDVLNYHETVNKGKQVSFYNIVHPEDVDAVTEMHRKVLHMGAAKSNYFRCVTNNALMSEVYVMAEAIMFNSVGNNNTLKYISLICHHLN
uniref:PAS domain-containing protein n=1 Tax=Rhabditophanes sp. KR3021 TaxID=114890 RepID=A0AC35U0K3_9BILA